MRTNKQQPSLVQRLAKRRQAEVTIALDSHPDRYLRAEARRRGWKLFNLWFCGGKAHPWLPCQGALVDKGPDCDLVESLRSTDCKVVRIGVLPHPLDCEVPAVIPDYKTKGKRAADYFFERGFRDVAYVAWEPWGELKAIYDGFKERAEELGITCHLLRFRWNSPERSERYLYRQKKLGEWMNTIPIPLGLFTHSDFSAAELCFMLANIGLDVPTDVAVLGRGNSQGICESSQPTVSSFASSREASVHAACDLLARWLAGETPPKKPVMVAPPEIVERQSTHMIAVSHPVVARAVQFMWDHFSEPLTADDVAEAVGVSRSKLYRLFNAHFPRTVKAELNRKRLEKCQQLLTTSDLTMARIAAATGFQSPEYMWEAFKKAFNASPRDYRRKNRG